MTLPQEIKKVISTSVESFCDVTASSCSDRILIRLLECQYLVNAYLTEYFFSIADLITILGRSMEMIISWTHRLK
jgi:hypothetical protein